MCTCLHNCRYVFGFILLFLFWFLPHLSSQPHASWELMILFGELSKSFKTVFKSCNSTFVLLQLRTCQASSVYLDFSSAKWSKISIFCMKLPVFCMGVNTSSAPSALRRLQLVFPWVRKLSPEEELLSCLMLEKPSLGKQNSNWEPWIVTLIDFFSKNFLERAYSWWGYDQMFMLSQYSWKSKLPRTFMVWTYFMQTNKPAKSMTIKEALSVRWNSIKCLQTLNFTYWDQSWGNKPLSTFPSTCKEIVIKTLLERVGKIGRKKYLTIGK